ncbi:MAG: hypothetical protein Q9M22_02885 [Mariprofundaceae bacterium]|nr:hypothetical protein [Mariprofundaceae bacterium]
MDRAALHILLVLLALLVVVAVIFDPVLAFYFVLVLFTGPPLVYSNPTATGFMLGYTIVLLNSLGLIWIGLKKREKLWGRIAVIVGILGWWYCGLIGNGTQV